jgi:Caspase domain
MDKRALLIGINYINTPNQLQGCIFDVIEIKSLLIDAYGFNPNTIITLRDDDPSNMPTRARIIEELQALIANATTETQIFLHYSGHGTQIADTNLDETDRLDECVVPCDYARTGYIKDDEINTIIRGLKGIGLAIFDCCRSGTIMDLPFTGVEPTNLSPVEGFYCLSGCQDNEDAYEETMGTQGSNTGLPQGAMTMAFISTVRSLNYYPTIPALHSAIVANLRQGSYDQTPQLTSTVSTGPKTPFPFDSPNEQLVLQQSITASLQTQVQQLQILLDQFQPQAALVPNLMQQVRQFPFIKKQLEDLQVQDASNILLIAQLQQQADLVPGLQRQSNLVPALQNQVMFIPGLQAQIEVLASQVVSQASLRNQILVLQNQIKKDATV